MFGVEVGFGLEVGVEAPLEEDEEQGVPAYSLYHREEMGDGELEDPGSTTQDHHICFQYGHRQDLLGQCLQASSPGRLGWARDLKHHLL